MVTERSEAGISPLSCGPLAAGNRIAGGQYLLKRLLGRGECSEVWLAWDRTREQDVALKFLPAALRGETTFIAKLQTETRRCQQLEHPGVARVHALVQDAEHLGVVLDRVDGWSLAALQVDRPEKRYATQEILSWVRQLCAALNYAHQELGLVHGDIKPSNLLLNAREQLKMTDFVLANLTRRALMARGHFSPAKIAHLSPQQLDAGETSVADDVYSLGACIYQLLTGTPPFYQGDIAAQVHLNTPPLMTGRLVQLGFEGAFPLNWEEAVAGCLAKDPARRPKTVGEVLSWLERPKPQVPAESTGAVRPGKDALVAKAHEAQELGAPSAGAPSEPRTSGEPNTLSAPASAGAPLGRTTPAVGQPVASAGKREPENAGVPAIPPGQRSPFLVYAAMFLLGLAMVFGLFLIFRKPAPATRNERSGHILPQFFQPYLGLGVAGSAPVAPRRERTA